MLLAERLKPFVDAVTREQAQAQQPAAGTAAAAPPAAPPRAKASTSETGDGAESRDQAWDAMVSGVGTTETVTVTNEVLDGDGLNSYRLPYARMDTWSTDVKVGLWL